MVGLPILTNVILTLIYNKIYGDIMYKTIADILEVSISILKTFTLYVTLAILINALLRKRMRRSPTVPIILLYIISVFITYLADFILTTNTYAYIVYLLFAVLGDAVIYFAALFICKKTVRKYQLTRPSQLSAKGKIISFANPMLRTLALMTIVIFGYNFIFSTIETVILITDVGFPINSTEVMFLIEPYISFIIYAVAGYLTMVAISVFWQKKVFTE
jgi:hypothetical protein